jgi:hypothetical protein
MTWTKAVLALALVLALAGIVGGESSKESGALTAGGRTVVGPLITSAAEGDGQKSLLSGHPPIDGCITIVNLGSSLARFWFDGLYFGLGPGKTIVTCEPDIRSVALECPDVGSACVVQWRLDVL